MGSAPALAVGATRKSSRLFLWAPQPDRWWPPPPMELIATTTRFSPFLISRFLPAPARKQSLKTHSFQAPPQPTRCHSRPRMATTQLLILSVYLSVQVCLPAQWPALVPKRSTLLFL